MAVRCSCAALSMQDGRSVENMGNKGGTASGQAAGVAAWASTNPAQGAQRADGSGHREAFTTSAQGGAAHAAASVRPVRATSKSPDAKRLRRRGTRASAARLQLVSQRVSRVNSATAPGAPAAEAISIPPPGTVTRKAAARQQAAGQQQLARARAATRKRMASHSPEAPAAEAATTAPAAANVRCSRLGCTKHQAPRQRPRHNTTTSRSRHRRDAAMHDM